MLVPYKSTLTVITKLTKSTHENISSMTNQLANKIYLQKLSDSTQLKSSYILYYVYANNSIYEQ